MRISANAQARRGVSAKWQALREEGINPRTNKPFARGGAYNTSGEKADSAAKLLAKAAAAAAKAGVAEAANKVASTEVRDLKQQVLDLKRQLEAAHESVELKVNNAKLEAQGRLAGDLLLRYQQGLAHGASLVGGHGMPSGPPASA